MTYTPLTKLQKRGLVYLLLEGEGSDYWFYICGGGPRGWRTMDSLERRGLVESVEWDWYGGDEAGWIRKLTPDGYRLACELRGAAA